MSQLTHATFNYLGEVDQYDHTPDCEPLPFDIELVGGSKNKDLRRLPAVDVRSVENWRDVLQFSVNGSGFQYVEHRSAFIDECEMSGKDMTDEQSVSYEQWTTCYGAELEQLIKSLFPHHRVSTYWLRHFIRNQPRVESTEGMSKQYAVSTGLSPSPRVHCDITRKGAESLFLTVIGDDMQALIDSGKRIVFFSIWRPLKTVQRDPIGVIDARTVSNTDLVKVLRTFPNGMTVEVLLAHANERHKWYWMSDQTKNDVLFIKLFDSEEHESRGASCTLHSSFELDGTTHEQTRESVDVRVAVVLE